MTIKVATAARRDAGSDLLRASADRVRYLDVPRLRCLMVDGAGAPGPGTFEPRIGLLYPVAYGIHFALKKRGVSSRVAPLEGLWWRAGEGPYDGIDSSRVWSGWTLLLALPEEATDGEVTAAIAEARSKRPDRSWADLRVESFAEGLSAQILHLGPYDREAPTIERLHAAIAADGLRPRGRHHEIYLGDPRRAAPERLRTIIRQPVEPAGDAGSSTGHPARG